MEAYLGSTLAFVSINIILIDGQLAHNFHLVRGFLNTMSESKPEKIVKYTCDDYRMEMRLLGMRLRLSNAELSDVDREKLQNEIDQLEKELGLS